jgi:hypothetical protein
VLATLLCCDAWFDVTLDLRTTGFMLSLLSAIFIELPLAGLAIIGARRLVRLTIGMVVLDGNPRPRLPLWRVPLFGLNTRELPGLVPAQRPNPAAEDFEVRQAENQEAC